MKLLIAIVQREDADPLCSRLNELEFRVTRINTVGGFLVRGNVTVLVGVEDDQVQEVLNAIRATCRTRRTLVNPIPWTPEMVNAAASIAEPIEVEIGGATIFSLPVLRFVRLVGGDPRPAKDWRDPAAPAGEAGDMRLMLVIVASHDADDVTRALLAAGHRLTRINTAGAFLRRGNATLLIGARRDRIDEILALVAANCRPRQGPNPMAAGMPIYSSTVFVLPAAQIVSA